MEFIKGNLKKLIAAVLVIVVLIGLMLIDVIQDSQMQSEVAQMKMKNVTDSLVNQMDREVGFLEMTAEKLDRPLMAKERENELRAVLKYVINRQSYQYGLFISPDRVINGTELISPTSLMNSGKKRYGDRVFWATPIIDSEAQTAIIPIYQPLSEPRLGVNGILFREVSINGLLTDAGRLNLERNAILLLISDDKQVINLVPQMKQTDLMQRVLEKHLMSILNQSYQAEDYLSFLYSERIASSHWHLVYIEPRHYDVPRLLAIMLLLLLPLGFMLIMRLKATQKVVADDEAAFNEILQPKLEDLGLKFGLMEHLKAEAYQIDWLRAQDRKYTQSILSFKMDVILAELLNKNDYMRSLCLKDLLVWAKGITEDSGGLQVEVGTGSERLHLNAAMVYELIALFEVLIHQEGLKQVEISPDATNQMLVLTLYGEQILNAKFTEALIREKAFGRQQAEIQRSFIGNRIVYKLENHKAPWLPDPSKKWHCLAQLYFTHLIWKGMPSSSSI